MSEREGLSIRRAYEPVPVDLGNGTPWQTRRVTRSVQQQIEAAEKELEAAETEDARVEALAAMIEARVEPADGSKPAKSKGAKATIVKLWKDDELSPGELLGLIDLIGASDDRPT